MPYNEEHEHKHKRGTRDVINVSWDVDEFFLKISCSFYLLTTFYRLIPPSTTGREGPIDGRNRERNKDNRGSICKFF